MSEGAGRIESNSRNGVIARSESSNLRKYQTRNPLARWIIRRFLDDVVEIVVDLGPGRIVDLGCGEGIVARAIRDRLPDVDYLGLDLSPDAVEVARSLNPDLEFAVGSVLDEPLRPGWADLALCLEVLEHLGDPDAALERILRWTRGHALVSVPWEPYFRLGNLLRGRHVGAWGDHPEHIQHFHPRSLGRLLSRHADDVSVRTRFPWLIGLIRVAEPGA